LAGFADYEVVELLLTLAIPRSDDKGPAKALINRFGNVRGILDAPVEELRQIKGIGSVAPVALRVIRAAATLYLEQSAEGTTVDEGHLERAWRARIGTLPEEVFEVAYLDSGLRPFRNGIERLEEGTIDRAAVYPRKVIESGLRKGAAALVLAHNHPDGRVEPTEEDRLLTRAIMLAAETVHIRILDHLIVSADQVFSFKKAGLL